MISLDSIKDEIYNPTLKEAWLNNYMESTNTNEAYIEKNIIPIFKMSQITETEKETDVSSFTLSEIIDLLRSFGSTSIASVRSRASLFRTYTDYAISKNFTEDGQNHFNDLMVDDYKKCISTRLAKVSFFDEDAIKEMVDALSLNARDQFLILAPWEGICGKMFSEMINLTLDDLDEDTNTVHLCTGRELKVSPELMSIMVDAGNTNIYISSESRERALCPSNLIYKPFNTNRARTVNTDVLTRRLAKLKVSLNAPSLGYTMIRTSGFCYYLAQLIKKTGKTVTELHEEKNEEYLELIYRYDFDRKQISDVVYTFQGYVSALPYILENASEYAK